MKKTRVLLATGVLALAAFGGVQPAAGHGGEEDGFGITEDSGVTPVDGATVTSDPDADGAPLIIWGAAAAASVGVGAGLYLLRRKRPGAPE